MLGKLPRETQPIGHLVGVLKQYKQPAFQHQVTNDYNVLSCMSMGKYLRLTSIGGIIFGISIAKMLPLYLLQVQSQQQLQLGTWLTNQLAINFLCFLYQG